MLIDTQAIKTFVATLSQEEINKIDVKNELLEQTKINQDFVFRLSLDNVMKIQNALNRKNKQIENERQEEKKQRNESKEKDYVGIDVGQSKIITASNLEMDKYIVLKSKKIKQEINKYKNSYKKLSKDKTGQSLKNLSRGFIDRVKHHVSQNMFITLNEKFGDDVIYVVGNQSLMTYKYDVQALLTDSIFEVLKEKSQTSDKVIDAVYGNERYSSVTCPKCHTGHPENREGDKFKCKNCEFEHDNVDVVACRNILEKFNKSYDDKGEQIYLNKQSVFKTGEYENFVIPPEESGSMKETIELERSGTMDIVREREKDSSGFTNVDDIIKGWKKKD